MLVLKHLLFKSQQ